MTDPPPLSVHVTDRLRVRIRVWPRHIKLPGKPGRPTMHTEEDAWLTVDERRAIVACALERRRETGRPMCEVLKDPDIDVPPRNFYRWRRALCQ